MDMFGQSGARERLPDRIVADVSDHAQTIEQAKRLKDACVNADADTAVTGFDFLQGGAGRKGTFRHDRHRQSPTSSGIVNIRSELAQSPAYGGGRIVWCWHLLSSHFRFVEYVARSLQI